MMDIFWMTCSIALLSMAMIGAVLFIVFAAMLAGEEVDEIEEAPTV